MRLFDLVFGCSHQHCSSRLRFRGSRAQPGGRGHWDLCRMPGLWKGISLRLGGDEDGSWTGPETPAVVAAVPNRKAA